MEVAACSGGSGVRLSSPDADCVIALRDHRSSVFRHHAQRAVFQVEMNLLACARIEMNAFESAESDERRTFDRWKLEIELNNLVSSHLSCVGHRDICAHGLACRHGLRTYADVAVAELRVAESVAEWIKRLAAEIAISAVRHPVI